MSRNFCKKYISYVLRATTAIVAIVFVSCQKEGPTAPITGDNSQTTSHLFPVNAVIPKPVSVTQSSSSFMFGSGTIIIVEPGPSEMTSIGNYLSENLSSMIGMRLPVQLAGNSSQKNALFLTSANGDPSLNDEEYTITVASDLVMLKSHKPVGTFRGVQTIMQLVSSIIDSTSGKDTLWGLPALLVKDYPRFVWRGAMLDVARHFFKAADVKRYIDLLAFYKINRFHIHLTDNEGWRIAINSWPNLAIIGGNKPSPYSYSTGYFTQAEYTDIVAHAQERYITLIPEIDMPGHMGAALVSYPQFNRYGNINFASDSTYQFLDDIIREMAALTPGPYIHLGGDEAYNVSATDYSTFVQRVQAIAQKYNKQMIGWADIAQSQLLASTIAQYWHWQTSDVQVAVQKGAKVIMSPANKVYLDMKYNASTTLGSTWAGYIEVDQAYIWEPTTEKSGVTENDILGVESPLWSETISTMADIEYLAFPRIIGHAEIGWSPQSGRNWNEYKIRLGSHGPRLSAMHINFYRSPLVPWK